MRRAETSALLAALFEPVGVLVKPLLLLLGRLTFLCRVAEPGPFERDLGPALLELVPTRHRVRRDGPTGKEAAVHFLRAQPPAGLDQSRHE